MSLPEPKLWGTRGRATRLPVLACLALLTAACTRGAVRDLPAPPPTQPATSTTARPDLSGVDLAGVPGTTTTSVLLGPGEADFKGVVVGPDGPVGGATILLERLAGDSLAGATLTTAADGTWTAENVLGGRWRVRAWRAPDLAMTTPESFFAEEAEERELSLRLEEFTGVVVTSAVAPAPPIVDEPARIVVRAYTRSVDEGGIVRNQPLPSVEMSLAGSSQWRVETENPTVADSGGKASWIGRCVSPGNHALAVRVSGSSEALALKLPACAITPDDPPAEEGSATSTTGRTATTRNSSSTTRNTTSTTRNTTSTTRRTTTTGDNQ